MVIVELKELVSEEIVILTTVKTRRIMLVGESINKNGRKIVKSESLYSTLNQMLNVLHFGLLKKTWLQ